MTEPEHIRWSDPYLYDRRLARLRAALPNLAVCVSAAFVCVLMAVIFANRFVF